MDKKGKTQRGITLIALVITIIVMLILVAVTISMAVNGGLFDYAGKAVGETNNALKAEQQLADGGVKVGDTWYNSIDEYLIASGNKPKPISKEKNEYIGCYADVDGNGTVDGVIYADLAFASEENAKWDYGYSYEAIAAEELKDYYVSGSHTGDFGTKDVLTATGTGKDRFYVMALEDFTEAGNLYFWYFSAYENENTEVVTADGFGTGKANTITMIEKWNASAFGAQNGDTSKYKRKDVWGAIQNSEKYDIVETVNDSGKWFVPSAAEWDAFADAFNMSAEYDDDLLWIPQYGLSMIYWSSSQNSTYVDMAWNVDFDGDYMIENGIDSNFEVRLSATF